MLSNDEPPPIYLETALDQLDYLVLNNATDAYIPLNINQSPFNIGMPVELPDFTPQQVATLAQRHGLPWTMEQVQPLMDLLGGYPYLMRLALYHLVQTPTPLEELQDGNIQVRCELWLRAYL